MPQFTRSSREISHRSGSVLLVTLIVVSLLTFAAFSFSDLMLGERRAAQAIGKRIQARALAESGIEAIEKFLTQDEQTITDLGGIYDNPGYFRGIVINDDPSKASVGRFTIIAPAMEDGYLRGLRFGLEDESAKVNVNMLVAAGETTDSAGRDVLMQLPGMTEDVADAILDFLDDDDEPRELGAEVDYYSGMSPPYAPKNGPLDSLDELLGVRGVTPMLLYGLDANRNGAVEPEERELEAELGVENAEGNMDFGWAAYLTLHSAERNLQADGTPKIDLNADDLQQLHTDLQNAFDTSWADFIIAYRQYGPFTGTKPGKTGAFQLDLTQKSKFTFSTVLDLVGAQVQAKPEGEEDSIQLVSPFPAQPALMKSYLPQLMDTVAVQTQAKIVGRINVNEASRVVLAGIPGITEDAITGILAARQLETDGGEDARRHETWLLTEEIVTLEEMKKLMPVVTGRGCMYRVQAVGFFDEGGPTARIEALIDASAAVPRVVSWKDLSNLGRGHTLATLGGQAP